MKFSTDYKIAGVLSLVKESEQLNLFDKAELMKILTLKYPRRKTRTVNDIQFTIKNPNGVTSQVMQRIPSGNTLIEKIFEEKLKENGIQYSKPNLLIESIPGNPDFIIPRNKIAIFCDGDFWHGYKLESLNVKNNSDFWHAKIKRNINRDEEVNKILTERQWKIFRFWEHQILSSAQNCVDEITNYIRSIKTEANYSFTFVDLFAGIGGFRIPLEGLGGKCLGFSEIDKNAIQVYKKNHFSFNDDEIEFGDITRLDKLPFENIDLIVGGVPCQAWSVAGKMKGFDDPRGKLWHDTIRVVELNKPKAFIFENVKGLIDPRNRDSLSLIKESFRNIGYVLKEPQILNSYDFGLPQNRDRIFIVGFRQDHASFINDFNYPEPLNKKSYLYDLIEYKGQNYDIGKKIFDPKTIFGDKIPMSRNRFQKLNELNDFFIFCDTRNGHTTIHSWDIIKTSQREKEICLIILKNRRKKIYGNSDGNPLTFKILKGLVPNLKIVELRELVKKKILRVVKNAGYEFVNSKNSAGINGIYRIYLPHSNIFSTLTATGTKDVVALENVMGTTPEEYKENFINKIVRKNLYRSISAKECGRLQGFPSWFSIHEDPKEAKKQFGNAVSTSVIYYLAKSLIETNFLKNFR